MKTVALILASLALLACTAESGVDFDKILTHPNGLVVERPVGFDARRSAEGFRFDEGGKLRNPRQLEVQRQDAPPPPDLASRRLGDGEARYKVEEDDGGSAGSEYRLWAAKPAGARWIVVSASEQSEDGEPTFALAWALLERARLQ
ncbi:T6SS effector muramidase immunity protein Tsi3 [Pseudomonas aeruginosa]|uniref:T6SS effector muramidase immunity protein Tsi3 n=1 Tax=Pseudomonas aeruginosa TaxID=287 RepID=UPI002F3F3CED